jgi:hypothetical protein
MASAELSTDAGKVKDSVLGSEDHAWRAKRMQILFVASSTRVQVTGRPHPPPDPNGLEVQVTPRS